VIKRRKREKKGKKKSKRVMGKTLGERSEGSEFRTKRV
jgi:hypothetical protein